MKTPKALAALLIAGSLAIGGFVSTQAFAEPPTDQPAQKEAKKEKKDKKEKKQDSAAKIGEAAPAFELTDTDGKTVKLEDFKGKIVVLEWFNPECPLIVKHHKVNTTFNTLHEEYNSKNVVFLAINSSSKGKQGHGKELNSKMKNEYKMAYPILLDEDGKVGKAYGAKTTPHCFVIDTTGKLVYAGAIDNNRDTTKAGDKNYVKMALDEVIAGKPVTTSETKPYGCSVKYAD